MSSANQYLPFANGTGANALTQAQYAALGTLLSGGFVSGVALSSQVNALFRQLSVPVSAISQFVADNQSLDVLDDGVVANYEAKFKAALLSAVQGEGVTFASDGGTADALVATPSPAFTAYKAGQVIAVQKNASVGANATATPTINLNGLGAVTITKSSGNPLYAGDLPQGSIFVCVYDGTYFRHIGLTLSTAALMAQAGQEVVFASSGTNAYTGALTPAPTALTPRMEVLGFFGTANTSTAAPTLALNGFAAFPILKQGGGVPSAGDIAGIVPLVLNTAGTAWLINGLTASDTLQVIQTQFLITTAITKTIGPSGGATAYDFPTPAAAIAWLGKYLITSTGSVTFQCAVNQFASSSALAWDHPNINRVFLKGTRTAAAPTTLAVTGYSSTNRANDAATNLTNLRNVFQTELRFIGGTGMSSVSPQPNFQDILITGDGNGSEATQANGLQLVNGGTLTNVATHGFAGAGVRCDGGQVIVPASSSLLVAACGPTASGSLESNSGSALTVAGTIVVAGGGSHGISCQSGSIRRNAGGAVNCYGNASNGANFDNGKYAGGGGAFTYNAGHGIAGYESTLDLFQTNAGGNGYYGLSCDGTPAVARNMTFNPANSAAGSGVGGTILAVGPASQVDAMNASVNSTESPAINVSGGGNRGASIRTS